MQSTSRTEIVGSIESSSEESSRSFHDLLLTRSKDCLPSPRRLAKAKLKGRKPWDGLAIRLRPAVGEAMIFAGGAAVGVGIMLLRKGEPIVGRPATAIAVGVGVVGLMIVLRHLSNSRIRFWRHAVRG
jgi:hypothetical protein